MSEGLIAEFDIDLNEVKESGFASVPDDWYEWTLGDVFLQKGSKNQPDKVWVIFKYLLGDDGDEYSELFSMPADASAPTKAELVKLGFYKARLKSLGVPDDQLNSVTSDDLIGATGVFELRTVKGKGENKDNSYQNVFNFKLNEGDEAEDAPAEEPVDVPKAAPAAKKAAAPRKTAAKPPTVVANPFA